MDYSSGSGRMFGEPKPGGILRVDINKPRRSSGSSVEFRHQPERLGQDLYEGIGPASPQPSVDRLSVTWADVEETSTKLNLFTPGTPPATSMEVRFPDSQRPCAAEASEDEDYSASVSAIMQRRASTRRSRRGAGRGRRASSPFGVADGAVSTASGTGTRRRSSAFTVSSGETAISMEDAPQEVTQEQIYENIRLHKEVLGSVKQQPWGMRRKLRLVNQAKAYIKRHEGALQERLAQSKCTRDIVARFNILLATKLQRLKREVANISNWVIPWELRIKEIESHFGSVVASYFTFLRWLFWVNLVISVVLVVFVVVPEILTADLHAAGERKEMLPEEKNKSTNLLTLWEFEGILKYSPIFYGYYTNRDPGEKGGYRLPLAYFMTGLAVYIYSFVATLRKMAENSRMSKLSEKEDECIFSWKLFTGWDYMIGNAETSHNRTASIILGFKEALLEEAEKKKVLRNWKIIIQRGIVNICVLFLLGVSAYAVVEVVRRSNEPEAETSWWRQNEITIVMSLISYIFPNFFDILGLMESYHPRRQLRIQLARIMLLNLLNLYSLIIALFAKITDMTKELERLKPSDLTTLTPLLTTTTAASQVSTLATEQLTSYEPSPTTLAYDITETFAPENFSYCFDVQINCPTVSSTKNLTATLMTIVMANITSFSSTIPYDLTSSTYALPSNNITTDYYDINTSDFTEPITTLQSTSTLFEDIYQNFTSTEVEYTSPETVSNIVYTDVESFTVDYNDTYYDSLYDDNNTENMSSEDYYADEPFRETFINNTELITTVLNYTTVDYTPNSSHDYIDFFPATTDDTVLNLTEITTEPTTNEVYSTEKEKHTSEAISKQENVSDIPYSLQIIQNSTESPIDDLCFVTRCVNMSSQEYTTKNDQLKSTVGYDDRNEELVGPSYMALIQSDYHFEKASSAHLDIETRKKLRKLCWETMFGQELVKLTMMDLVLTIMATLFTDFFRAVFVRFMNRCWCWDLEKKFPQYGDFKIAENILHLVNNQGMVWMGMFFSPGLVVLNLIKLVIIMYLRSWAVMTCNVPHEVVFRASRSNNFYLALLLTMLFLCVLPVGYAIVWVEPSWHCGPFSNYKRIYHLFTQSLLKFLPKSFHKALDYIASPGIIIPLLVLLILIIYYLLSLTGALREANNDLKIQLRRERTEERRKMFQMADKRGRGGSNELENTPFAKWKKILPVMPTNKTGDAKGENGGHTTNAGDKTSPEKKDLLAKIVKTAFRKSSGTSDDESCLAVPPVDDETDTDFHESLPEDVLTAKDITFTPKPKTKHMFDIAKTKTHIENEQVKRNPKIKKVSLKERKLDDEIVKEQETNKKSLNLHLKNGGEKDKKADTKILKSSRPQFPQQYKPEIIAEHRKSHREFKRSISDDGKTRHFNISNVPEADTGGSTSKQDFEMRSGQSYRMKNHQGSLPTSMEDRQNSITSIIPVITISKTESDEDVLDDNVNNGQRVKKKHPKSPVQGDKSTSKSKKHDSYDNAVVSSSKASPSKTLKRQKIVDVDKSLRDHHDASSSRTTDNVTDLEFDSRHKEKSKTNVKDELVRSLLKAAKEWRDGKRSPDEKKQERIE